MLSQQLPKCNNYSFFSNVNWQLRGGGGGGVDGGWEMGVKKGMHSESEKILGHLAEQSYTYQSVG